MTSTGYLCRSAQRRYMRMSISAKSAASTPPASERMVTSASRESYSPDSRVRTSSSSMAVRMLASSRSVSAVVASSFSSAAISCSSATSSSRERSSSTRRRSPCRYDSREVSAWAASTSFHRSGAAACCSRSAISWRRSSMRSTASIDFRVVFSSSRTTEKSAATSVEGSAPAGRGRGSLRSGGLGGQPRGHPCGQLVGRHRPGDQVTLGEGATEIGRHRELLAGLHALGDGAHAEGPRQTDHGGDGGGRLAGRAVRAVDQAAVDLEHPGRQRDELTERGEAAPEVVDGHLDAREAQGGQIGGGALRILG